MEVEIEDLHVQMEDISKTKQAVSIVLCSSLSVLSRFSGSCHRSLQLTMESWYAIHYWVERNKAIMTHGMNDWW